MWQKLNWKSNFLAINRERNKSIKNDFNNLEICFLIWLLFLEKHGWFGFDFAWLSFCLFFLSLQIIWAILYNMLIAICHKCRVRGTKHDVCMHHICKSFYDFFHASFKSAHRPYGFGFGHRLRIPNFKYPKYFGPLGKLAKWVSRYFRVFLVLLSAQILSLFIPSM